MGPTWPRWAESTCLEIFSARWDFSLSKIGKRNRRDDEKQIFMKKKKLADINFVYLTSPKWKQIFDTSSDLSVGGALGHVMSFFLKTVHFSGRNCPSSNPSSWNVCENKWLNGLTELEDLKEMNETLKTKNWMESIELTVHLKSAARECNFNGKTKCQVTRRTNWKQSRELIWFSQEKKAKIEEKQKQDSSRLGKSTIKFPAETKAQGTERVLYFFVSLISRTVRMRDIPGKQTATKVLERTFLSLDEFVSLDVRIDKTCKLRMNCVTCSSKLTSLVMFSF